MMIRFGGIGCWLVAVLLLGFQNAQGSEETLKVACIGADGQIKNATQEDVCKAILPKCSDVVSKNSKDTRRMLSMKIMGYYKGLDLDLERSSKDNLVGAPLNIPVCSLVGHDLSKSDHEYSKQSVGLKSDCGGPPRMNGKGGSKRLYLSFEGDRGMAWSAWMMGAYPWGIRSAAYDVLNPLKPDLSNLDALIKSEPMMHAKSELANSLAGARKFYRTLSDEAKVVCNSGATDVVKRCLEGGFSVTDPAIRVCTLYRAQLAFGEAALSNLLAGEIMARAQDRHDELFGSVIQNETRPESSTQGMMNQLMYACNRRTGDLDVFLGGAGCGGSRRRKLATVGSCLNNGNRHYTNKGYNVIEGSNPTWVFPLGRCPRNGSRRAQFDLRTGQIETNIDGRIGGGLNSFVKTSVPPVSPGGGGGILTRHKGFAGGIEFLIRRVLCGAAGNQQSTPRCDISEATGIPSKPADMSW
jgi:hypothetical protein